MKISNANIPIGLRTISSVDGPESDPAAPKTIEGNITFKEKKEKIKFLKIFCIDVLLIKIQYIFFDAEKIMGSHYIPKRKLKLT